MAAAGSAMNAVAESAASTQQNPDELVTLPNPQAVASENKEEEKKFAMREAEASLLFRVLKEGAIKHAFMIEHYHNVATVHDICVAVMTNKKAVRVFDKTECKEIMNIVSVATAAGAIPPALFSKCGAVWDALVEVTSQ